MIRDAVAVRLSPEERAVLKAKFRAPTTEQRQVFRARIVLLAVEKRSTRSIARELGTMPVSGWRGRFAREGLAAALTDMPAGRDRCWPRPWAMCMSSRSGA